MNYHYDKFNRNEFESHRLALGFIKGKSKVLDIGCATGYFAKELIKINCETWGVDGDKEAIKKAKKFCKQTILCDLDNSKKLEVPKRYFDYVLMLDVLEHLCSPESILETVKPHLRKDGHIIVSVPNIAHASIRWMLLQGKFQYTTTGILDKTHLHFYTKKSIVDLIAKSGYRVLDIIPTNGMCKVPFLYKVTDRLPSAWQYKIANIFPELFSFQFVIKAKS